jgi:hypothetical protein
MPLTNVFQIENGAFDQLNKLTELNLDYNEKLTLTENTFGSNGLVNLEYLFLGYCNLKTLPNSMLKNMP